MERIKFSTFSSFLLFPPHIGGICIYARSIYLPVYLFCNSVVSMAQLIGIFTKKKKKKMAVRIGGGFGVLWWLICAFHTPNSSVGMEWGEGRGI